jgi:hypothetical protein
MPRFDTLTATIYSEYAVERTAICFCEVFWKEIAMKRFKGFLFGFSLIFLTIGFGAPAMSADMGAGSVSIISPKNGEVFENGAGIRLSYDVHLGPTGNHLHVYVDDQPPIITHDVTACPCSVTLPTLSAGQHEVDVKEATAAHVLTGVESSVKFTVK